MRRTRWWRALNRPTLSWLQLVMSILLVQFVKAIAGWAT